MQAFFLSISTCNIEFHARKNAQNRYGLLFPAASWVEVAELAAACWCLVTRGPSSTALYPCLNESNSLRVGVGLCSKSLNFSVSGRPPMYWRAIKAFFSSTGYEGSSLASRFFSSHLKTAGSSSERRLRHSNSA